MSRQFIASADFTEGGERFWSGRTVVDEDSEVRAQHPDRFREFDADAERRRLLELARDPRNVEGPVRAADAREALPSALGPRAAESRDACYAAVDELYDAGHLTGEAGLRLRAVAERDTLGTTANYVAAVSDPNYYSAFLKRMADPDGTVLTDREREAVVNVQQAEAVRAMSLGEGKLGGYGVPAQLDPSILLTSSGSVSPLRELARTVTVTGTNLYKGVSSEGVEVSFDGELAEVSDDSPELAQPEIPLEKCQGWIPFSIEFGEDYGAAAAELARLLRDAKDQIEAEKFTLGEGSGSKEPEGTVSKLASGSLLETATKEVVVASDVYALQEALGPRFSPNASWLSTLTVANQIYRFYNPTGEEPPLFNPDRSELLGKPWHEASNMSSKTTTKKSKVLLYGDIRSAYTIVDRVGLSIELVPHTFGENGRPLGQRGYYCWWRVGAAPVVDNAARLLVVKE